MNVEKRLGRCYELAFNHFALVSFMRREAVLVHGVIRDTHIAGLGAVICHAWVECDGEVWEPITQTKLPKDAFFRIYDAEETYRYNRTQVCDFALDTEHSGPWEPMPEHLQRTIPEILQGSQS